MKGVIQPDHIPTNNYELLILTLPKITAVTMSGIEDELETTELPDRTVASGGNRKATEVTLGVPMHHLVEQAALEVWFTEAQGPVSPSYKKAGTLLYTSASGEVVRSYTVIGVFPKKRSLPEGEMKNEGEQANVEWVFSIDDLLPI